jgi:hypothetical protein
MRKAGRRKMIALLATGMMIGIIMVATPASALTNWVNVWNNHLKPQADARYVKKSAIKTIQGDYALGLQAANTGDDGWDNISFGFKLASEPQEHFIKSGTAAPAVCPGTLADPKAAPGHLCVYEGDATNRSDVVIFSAGHRQSFRADEFGAGLWLIPAAAGNAWSYGTWAVTAPAGTSPSLTDDGSTGGGVPGQ